MFGVQAGCSVDQHPTHRIERAKDHNSISGVCGSHRRLQGLQRVGMQAGRDVPATARHHMDSIPLLLQHGSRLCARRGKVGEIPTVYQRSNLGQHRRQVLVRHRAKHRVGGRKKPHCIQIGRERGHGVRVVRHVQHQGRLPRHDLEAPRQLHHGHAVTHSLGSHRQPLTQCLESRQHARGVHQLVGPPQGRISQPGIAPPAASPVPLLLVTRKFERI